MQELKLGRDNIDELSNKSIGSGSRKYDVRTASRHAFKKFYLAEPEADMMYLQYKSIIHEINNYYMNHAMETGHLIVMPYGLGKVGIVKYKKSGKPIMMEDGTVRFGYQVDWVETAKAKKIIYHLNGHSDGYTYIWRWYKETSRIKAKEIWKVFLNKNLFKVLSDKLRDTTKEYPQLYRESIINQRPNRKHAH